MNNKNKLTNSVKNIGFIMDGNRRWAIKNKLNLYNGYQKGALSFLQAIQACLLTEMETAVFYALSLENYEQRHNIEINTICQVGFDEIKKNINFFLQKKIKCTCIGMKKKYTTDLKKNIKDIEKKTNFSTPNLTVYILLVYDFITDLKNYFKKNNSSSKNIPALDLIIRTGGHNRLSGFLPIQSMYSNIISTKLFWPQMTTKRVVDLINKGNKIINNYGK